MKKGKSVHELLDESPRIGEEIYTCKKFLKETCEQLFIFGFLLICVIAIMGMIILVESGRW